MERFPLLPLTLLIALLIGAGCDQQQPLADKPQPTPGAKEGETPPVEPDQGPQRRRDGSVPLPPATAPTTPGIPNHPAAPQVPETPTVPPPTSSPTQSPALVPPSQDDAALAPDAPAGTSTPGIGLPSVGDAARRDSSITSAVYRALASQPGLSHDGALVTISTMNGEVTLRGAVASAAERDQLALLAGQVAGVRSVNNRLDLLGP